ncbi:putative Hepatocellular carcinoma-associated antigen 59 [Monocercomonoides exilis]|uniref:putative Hepatocellular carcinoma-associated antigen 59 n=1 Tax=Monocercomonoides exilis TaxID=2049356 RepID=UPI003559AB27|nr:putative Hepatocellular carcinoma-associated antigen 59 [Monocercomonoides exilis]|eukprot:MONOS_14685.1-p1 / transcript=MONOS_14685.1 / gene=MONOS_14685 / organism=Monocercomonoides_exilis_PA203 / gene_product=unspecified product / transcript_product=unspecified product / location=Mono_scaffold01050:18318-19490(+) / protein_length=283 / sequence_SO=supercontig / SO=protein_coding / is_pseudo=false
MEQKMKEYISGLDAETLSIITSEKKGKEQKQSSEGTFAQESTVFGQDARKQLYIEEKLKEKSFIEKTPSKKPDEMAKSSTENQSKRLTEEDLFKVPESLKAKQKPPKEVASNWDVGISEVELPIKFKKKNMQATETAYKRLVEKEASQPAPVPMSHYKSTMTGLALPIDDDASVKRMIQETVKRKSQSFEETAQKRIHSQNDEEIHSIEGEISSGEKKVKLSTSQSIDEKIVSLTDESVIPLHQLIEKELSSINKQLKGQKVHTNQTATDDLVMNRFKARMRR